MKRSVILTLCIILCLALSLGGTIAYLTDSDGDVNVMTLGRVDITLEEYQRGDDQQLEGYEDDRMLHPQVGEDGTPDRYGLPTNPTFHDKIVRVTGDSRNANAFLRVWIGVPSQLLDVADGLDAVHLVLGEGVTVEGDGIKSATVDGWPWEPGEAVQTTIEGVSYTMFCFDYTEILKPGDVTPPVLAGLYLDKHVDNDDSGAYVFAYNGKEYPLNVDFSGGLQIPVLAQAVQADGFGGIENASAAFEAAGMNDPALFDEYLDLNVNPISEAVQQLIDAIRSAIAGGSGDAPYEAALTTSIVLTDDAAMELNAAGEAAGGQEVHLRVQEGETVIVDLQNPNVPLDAHTLIVNDGGELTITGN